MKRLILDELKKWKNSDSRKPLILDGARQVGKTWILQEFGKTEYENCVYINCDKNQTVKDIFEQDFNTERIIRNLGAISKIEITPSNTLIILDEIQEIPSILPSLKYFCENSREYNVVAAGSLLGLNIHSGTSFPVGKVDLLHLYPMNFFEFIMAICGENFFNQLSKSSFEELSPLHSECTELLRQYYFTGGMPEAVLAFKNKKSLYDIRNIQKTILYAYEKDISKHAGKDVQRIHQVWESIPQQLAKENKRFIYGAIKHGARAKDFETAIQWLIDAGLIYKIPRAKTAKLPLKFYEDFDNFKLFMLDCGLFGALTETPADQILIGNNIFEEYKGAFTEQFVLQELKTLKNLSIYYYSAEKSELELDFLLQKESKLIPIEVKAEENLRAKSLRLFVQSNPELHGIRFSMSKHRKQDWMTNIPLYLSERICTFA